MVISDSPVICRIAQLHVRQKKGILTSVEENELRLCLDWLVNTCYQEALIKNFSLMAHMTDDINWQHDLCGELDNM